MCCCRCCCCCCVCCQCAAAAWGVCQPAAGQSWAGQGVCVHGGAGMPLLVGCPHAPVAGFLSTSMYLSSCCRAAEPKQLCAFIDYGALHGEPEHPLTAVVQYLAVPAATPLCSAPPRGAMPVFHAYQWLFLWTRCVTVSSCLLGPTPPAACTSYTQHNTVPAACLILFCRHRSCCADVTLTLQAAAAAAATTHTRAKAACSRPVMALVMALVAMLAVMLCSCFLASLLHLK